MANLASPASQPAFDGMIGLLLIPNQGTTASTPVPLASPSQIADAMIRSMLGGPAVAGTFLLGTTLNATSDASDPAVISNDVPAAATGTPDPTQNSATPNQPPTPPTPKQPRAIKDLPMVTTVVTTPAPIPVVFAPPATSPLDSKSAPAKENTSPPPVPVATATPLLKNILEAKVAFSAVLTPMNPSTIPDATKPIAVSPEPAVVSSAAAVCASAPPLTVQGLSSPASIQAVGEKTAGDTPSQQHDDSPRNSAQPVVIATDSKIKSAAPQQNDSLGAAAASVREVCPSIVGMSIAPADQPHSAGVQSPVGAPAAATLPSTAEALRTSESNIPAAPQLRTGMAQEIAIRIAPPDAPAVDLRIVEHSGQVHVDVRTSDTATQTSLRQDLGALTNSLHRAGYHAETFTPSTAGLTASSTQTTNQDRQEPSQNRNGSDDFSGGRRQQQQQKRSGTWLEELEEQP